jgi:hypothetical protein
MNVHPPLWDKTKGIANDWKIESKTTEIENRENEMDERTTIKDRVLVAGSGTKGFTIQVSNIPNESPVKDVLTVKYQVSDACTSSNVDSKILSTTHSAPAATSATSAASATQYNYTIAQVFPASAIDKKRVGCKLSLQVEIKKKDGITLTSPLYPYKSHGLLVVGRDQSAQDTIIVADTPTNIQFNGKVVGHESSSNDVIAWIPKKETMTNDDCAMVQSNEMFVVDAAGVDTNKWTERTGKLINVPSINQEEWERVLCYSFAGEPPVLYQDHILYVRHLIDVTIVPVNDVGAAEGKGSSIEVREDTITDGGVATENAITGGVGGPRKVLSMRLANKADTNNAEGTTNDNDFVKNKYNWNVQLLLPPWVTTKGIDATKKDKLKLVPFGESCDYSIVGNVVEFEAIEAIKAIAPGSTASYTHQLLPAETTTTATAAAFYALNGRPPKEDTINGRSAMAWDSNKPWLGGYQFCYQHGEVIETTTDSFATNPHLFLEATCDDHYWGPSCTRCPGFNRKDKGANGTCSGHGECVGSGSHLDITQLKSADGTLVQEFVYYSEGSEGSAKYNLGDCACNRGLGINTGWDSPPSTADPLVPRSGADGGYCSECGGPTKTVRWLSRNGQCKDCGGGFQRGEVTPTHLNKIIQGMSKDGYGGIIEDGDDFQQACVKCAPAYFGNKEECIMCPTRLPNGQPFEQQCSGHGECRNSGQNPEAFLELTLDDLKAIRDDKDDPVCTCRPGTGFEGLDCGSCSVNWYYQGGVACVACEEFPDRCLGGRDPTHQCINGYAGDKCLECSRVPAFNSSSPRNGYYKLGRECVPCPENDIVLILIICALIIVVLIMLLFIYKIAQSKLPLAPIASAIRHMQFMSFFIQIQLPYPKFLLDIYNKVSAVFSFNFADMTSPECIVETSYLEEWVVYTSGPLLLGKNTIDKTNVCVCVIDCRLT